ncbi:hypothetical protein KI387_036144, partial [Taxus chinensis]
PTSMATHIPVFGGVFRQGEIIQAFGLTYKSGRGCNSGSGALSQIVGAQFSGTLGALGTTPTGPSKPSGSSGSGGSRGIGP